MKRHLCKVRQSDLRPTDADVLEFLVAYWPEILLTKGCRVPFRMLRRFSLKVLKWWKKWSSRLLFAYPELAQEFPSKNFRSDLCQVFYMKPIGGTRFPDRRGVGTWLKPRPTSPPKKLGPGLKNIYLWCIVKGRKGPLTEHFSAVLSSFG